MNTMNPTTAALQELLNRVPRRHSPDNVKEIVLLMSGYENVLMRIESTNTYYEKESAVFFSELENIRAVVKKSTDNKASKKNKDDYFQEAAGNLKQNIEAMINVFGEGSQSTDQKMSNR